MTDAFMEDARADRPHPLRHPRTGEIVRTVPANALFERIARAAHRSGDPGLFFLDAANRANPTPALGAFEATNPCGEVPLLPYEACNLGSLNLGHMVRRGAGGKAIDWGKLARTARLAVRFLDDVIEVGRRPAPPIDAAVRRTRKIGLGVMGFAELLLHLGIAYDSTATRSPRAPGARGSERTTRWPRGRPLPASPAPRTGASLPPRPRAVAARGGARAPAG